jgi:tetratricopeptide (TPR) repeat protein
MDRLKAWMESSARLAFRLPAGAGQDDPRLDELFGLLRAADCPEDAERIEERIWDLWTSSGDPAVDRLMRSGMNALAARHYDAALDAFDEVTELAPGFAEGWNKRATVNYLIGDYDESISDVERTLSLEPRHFGALSGLALIALALGEEEQALDAFEAALEIHPQMTGASRQARELRARVRGREI